MMSVQQFLLVLLLVLILFGGVVWWNYRAWGSAQRNLRALRELSRDAAREWIAEEVRRAVDLEVRAEVVRLDGYVGNVQALAGTFSDRMHSLEHKLASNVYAWNELHASVVSQGRSLRNLRRDVQKLGGS